MVSDHCVIRHFRQTDLDDYIRFHAKAKSVCHSDDTLLIPRLADGSLDTVTFSHKNLFLAEEEGQIVGACRLVPELAIARVVLRLFILPGDIDCGIADRLLRSALERADEYRATVVHADLREEDQDARELFAGMGFRPVRRYTDMMLALDPASISGADRRELSQRALKPGEEEEFTRLQNHIFDGAWGFCPNTTAEIVLLLNTRGYGYDGVILSHKGEKIVGYCWTAKLYSSDRKRNAVTGRIHMMGVTPESRRQGVGTYILRGGLNHLASAGIHSVELTTDNENRAACSLYRKAGFKPKAALVWYEKKLR